MPSHSEAISSSKLANQCDDWLTRGRIAGKQWNTENSGTRRRILSLFLPASIIAAPGRWIQV